MPAFTPTVALWFCNHHGVASSSELARLGMSQNERKGLVHLGVLQVVHRGVYHLTSSPVTFESRCRAACANGDEFVICDLAGARLWTLRGLRPSDDVVVASPHASNPFARGVRVRRTNALPPGDVVVRADGIRLTTPPRTVFDLARNQPDQIIEALIEQLLDHH